ncbi:LysE family translocator [Streptomyces deserti]
MHGPMVSTDRLLAFAAMSFLLIVVPGPSVLFVIGRALAHGRRAALTTVVGNTLGAYLLVVAVALGIGAVVERSVLAFTVLKLAGAAYLVYLGVKAWRQRGSLREAFTEDSGEHGTLRTLWEGFAVGVANPKTIVFFAAVLPQFVDRDGGMSRSRCCCSAWSSTPSRWPATACGGWPRPPHGAGSRAPRGGSPPSAGSADSP